MKLVMGTVMVNKLFELAGALLTRVQAAADKLVVV
jgi:hypothetical protein